MSKELQEIITRVGAQEPNQSSILATVVDVRGSSYRLPGARMLIAENGETFGTISGGCLESDVMERAKRVLQTGAPQVFVYDTTATEDSVFSFNMGCRGVVRILLEKISADNQYLNFLADCVFSWRGNGVVVTQISVPQNSSDKVGARLFFSRDEINESDFDANREARLMPDVRAILADEKSELVKYEDAEFLIEFVKPTLTLFVFGAGADAVPLISFAKNLGWTVEVIDHRPAFATSEQFPSADRLHVSRPDNFLGFTPSEGNYAAVVMTHNYAHDKEILWRLLNANVRYIGALGPKRRTENILRELQRDEGKTFPPENLENLYAPVGLDIGATTPEAIALSIVAEIQSVLSGREGGFLRNRNGSIYGRTENDNSGV